MARALSAVQVVTTSAPLERLGALPATTIVEAERQQVARQLGDRVGVDVEDAQAVDAERGAEGERLELGLAAGADHRHDRGVGRARGARAASADVAAVRSAVRIVISARNVG